MSDSPPPFRHATLTVCVVLVIAVGVCFGPSTGHEFLVCDDDDYVYENPQVRQGLGTEGIRWAFTSAHAANYHPLTWISHMLDVSLWGLNPAGHHLTNVGLHAAAAVLLFLALRRLSGAFWRAAFVAALFAVHPLRVESVAWVAERKDVLSGFFFMLTLLAWAGYARRGGATRYLLVAISLTLGLLSKPMLVTVPLLLLLLDVWPLRRSGSWLRLGLEKVPLLALSAAASLATVSSQSAGSALDGTIPAVARLLSAATSYVAYVGKLLWPHALAIHYPHPFVLAGRVTSAMVWRGTIAALVLAAVTVIVLRVGRRRPYLGVGWAWYLGMLVPVSGIVQVGTQSMADRYTYLPTIGLLVMIVWGVAELRSRTPRAGPAVSTLAVSVLAALAVATTVQVGRWRDSHSIFEHSARVVANSYFAHNHWGLAFAKESRFDEARTQFARAIEIRPRYSFAHNNLGACHLALDDLDQAATHFETALRWRPENVEARTNLAIVRRREGRLDEARLELERVLAERPDYVNALNILGIVDAQQGDLEAARARFLAVLEIDPFHENARRNLERIRDGR